MFNMNFSLAVKGVQNPSSMLALVNSRAEVELGHKLSDAEISKLSDNFSFNTVFDATNKVQLIE